MAMVATRFGRGTNNLGNHRITAKYAATAPSKTSATRAEDSRHATLTTLTSALTGASNAVGFAATVASNQRAAEHQPAWFRFGMAQLSHRVPLSNRIVTFTNFNYLAGATRLPPATPPTRFCRHRKVIPTSPNLAGRFTPANGAFR
jgi:hypothetical protein